MKKLVLLILVATVPAMAIDFKGWLNSATNWNFSWVKNASTKVTSVWGSLSDAQKWTAGIGALGFGGFAAIYMVKKAKNAPKKPVQTEEEILETYENESIKAWANLLTHSKEPNQQNWPAKTIPGTKAAEIVSMKPDDCVEIKISLKEGQLIKKITLKKNKENNSISVDRETITQPQ